MRIEPWNQLLCHVLPHTQDARMEELEGLKAKCALPGMSVVVVGK